MTEDPRDRLLDHALERVFREGEEPDLTAPIVQAWSRGVTGSVDIDHVDLDAQPAELEPSRNGSARPASRPRRLRLWPAAAVAAAAVLVVVALWTWLPPALPEAALAVASADVELVSGVDGTSREGTLIGPGDTVLVESGGVEVEVGGALLRVGPGTVLVAPSTEGGPFRLELGSVELVSGPEPFLLAAPFASIRARAETELGVRVELGDRPAGWSELAFRDGALTLLEPGFSGRRSLALDVLAGAAELEHEGSLLTVVPPGGRQAVSGPVQLAEEDVERFDTSLAKLLEIEERLYEGKGFEERLALMDELTAVLDRSRPLWSRLERRARSLPSQAVGHVVDFLQVDPSPEALALASALWLEAPEAFRDAHMVTFAERGAFEFEREIEAQVDLFASGFEPEPLPGFELEPGLEPMFGAAYLAVGGDDAGRGILEDVLMRAMSSRWVSGAYVAALGLDRLGYADVWPLLQERVQEEIRLSLENSDVITAADTLLRYEYVHQLREEETPRLGTFQLDVSRWLRAQGNELQSEFDVLERMDELFD